MIYILIAISALGLDQISKYLVRHMMTVGEEHEIIGSFFKIAHVENGGAAFGMLAGNQLLLTALPAVIVVIAAFVIIRDIKKNELGPCVRAALTMIASGGVGNMIDRAVRGTVTDMFSFSIFPPVFNVADIFVTLGCALLVFGIFYGSAGKDKETENRKV